LVGYFELIAWKSVDAVEHVSKHLGVESPILVERPLTEINESIAICHRRQIHEISRFGSSKNSKNLVDGKFLSGENWTKLSAFNWKEPGIGSKVDLCDFLVLPDLQAEKTSPFSNTSDIHTGFVESTFYGRHQLVNPAASGPKKSRSRV
jgi:hypothetical protein